MEYEKLISVSGMPGLYEMQTQKGDGVIVTAIKDNSSKFISNRLHRVTLLKDIEIYTTGDNVSLNDVFKVVKDSSEAIPEVTDKDAVIGYFKKVYPIMDFEKVYYSDMKKLLLWYNELKAIDFDFVIKEKEPEEVEEPKKEDVKREKPKEVKKSEAKKSAPKKETKENEEKPKVKKAATKKEESKPVEKKKEATKPITEKKKTAKAKTEKEVKGKKK